MKTPDELRSRIMRAVKSKNTKPEWIVRRVVHAAGYRYRLHVSDLPGKPDLVFPSRRKVIFVHGCWWHGHDCSRGARKAKANAPYWSAKIERNVSRDAQHLKALRSLGWRVLTVWECQLENSKLKTRLSRFLNE